MEKKGAATPQDVERCNKALDEAFVLAQKIAPLTPENKWALDGTKEGVTVHSTYDATGVAMSRGEGIIDVPMEDLVEYLVDERYLGEYDSSMEVNERLATIDDKTSVVWELTKKITFISQRDFLYTCRWFEKDGSIYIVAKSVDWPSKPAASGHVRALLRPVAWILTPVKDKPTSTHTVHLVSVDLCGSIPTAIVTRETLKQGYVTIKIRDTIAAWLKKRGPRKVVEKKPVEEKKAEPVTETKKEECCAEKKECTEKKACCEEKKSEPVAETKKEECCAEKKACCEEKKAEPVAETKKEECCAEKKECTEKKACCDEKKAEPGVETKKEECCAEKKECCAEKKECCEKEKECTEKKECCEKDKECVEKKEAAEEPKKAEPVAEEPKKE